MARPEDFMGTGTTLATKKVWSDEEIRAMWPQAAGELRMLERALEAKAGMTASQLGMALQLAEAGFKNLKNA